MHAPLRPLTFALALALAACDASTPGDAGGPSDAGATPGEAEGAGAIVGSEKEGHWTG